MNGVNHCGVAYLEHLQAEHRRLNRALVEIRLLFAEFNDGTQPQAALTRLMEHLEDLLKELRSHFTEEEEGGCLDEAVARCPSLAPLTKDLMGEHPQLVHSLEQLVAAMKRPARNGEAWQRQFDALAADLRAHECAENRLLQTAFGGEAAEYDVEGNE